MAFLSGRLLAPAGLGPGRRQEQAPAPPVIILRSNPERELGLAKPGHGDPLPSISGVSIVAARSYADSQIGDLGLGLPGVGRSAGEGGSTNPLFIGNGDAASGEFQ